MPMAATMTLLYCFSVFILCVCAGANAAIGNDHRVQKSDETVVMPFWVLGNRLRELAKDTNIEQLVTVLR